MLILIGLTSFIMLTVILAIVAANPWVLAFIVVPVAAIAGLVVANLIIEFVTELVIRKTKY